MIGYCFKALNAYVYNTSNKSIKIIVAGTTNAQMFNYKGTIYYHSNSKGLFKIENGISVLVSDNPVVKNDVVLGIFSMENKPLLVTEKGGFYFLREGNLTRWYTPFEGNSEPFNIYSSIRPTDGSIVLRIIANGIYRIGKTGKIIQKINQEKALNNNTILALFEDSKHHLWLALDNDISLINIDSPFNKNVDKNEKLDIAYASII